MKLFISILPVIHNRVFWDLHSICSSTWDHPYWQQVILIFDAVKQVLVCSMDIEIEKTIGQKLYSQQIIIKRLQYIIVQGVKDKWWTVLGPALSRTNIIYRYIYIQVGKRFLSKVFFVSEYLFTSRRLKSTLNHWLLTPT